MEKTIFFISPIGKKDSPERLHSDKMMTEILLPVAAELGLTPIRGDEISEDPEKIEDIYKYIAHSKILVADLYHNNPNVLHEIGIALAWGISPIYIAPDSVDALPFDIQHQSRIMYADEFDGNRNAHILNKLRDDLKKKIEKSLENPDMLIYRRALPYVQKHGEYIGTKTEENKFALGKKVDQIEDTLCSKLDAIKDDVENVFSHIVKGEQSFNAIFIDGEGPAFAALTDAVNRAQVSVRTTQFSPYSVVGRHDEFFSAIQSATGRLRDGLFRVLAINSPEKLREANQLLIGNIGKNMTIVFTDIEYSFEIVVIDNEEAFIHFRRANQQQNLISATLHVREKKIASEFSVIFDQIVKANAIRIVDCSKLSDEDIADVIREISKYFTKQKEKTKEA